MFRKFLVALLLLPFASIAVADEDGPNPGDDNPGSTTFVQDFYFAGHLSGEASCFDTSEFCSDYYIDLEVEPNAKGKGKHTASASATAFAQVACTAAVQAQSAFGLFFEGGGELSLTRHGNHGAMHHIEFGGGLASGAMTLASADAAASAWAHADAWAFADAAAWEDVCTTLEILDVEILEFCAYAEAVASGAGLAIAEAGSFASGGALAESGTAGQVMSQTVVYGANIEEFYSAFATQAGSFAAADASAYAQAWATAYSEAFASAYAEACNSVEIFDDAFVEICSDGEADADAYASAYAEAYAEAQASALAEVYVEAYMPAYYKNENGINDTIDFGPSAEAYAEAIMLLNCDVPEDPDEE
jgi:hypothetical protein